MLKSSLHMTCDPMDLDVREPPPRTSLPSNHYSLSSTQPPQARLASNPNALSMRRSSSRGSTRRQCVAFGPNVMRHTDSTMWDATTEQWSDNQKPREHSFLHHIHVEDARTTRPHLQHGRRCRIRLLTPHHACLGNSSVNPRQAHLSLDSREKAIQDRTAYNLSESNARRAWSSSGYDDLDANHARRVLLSVVSTMTGARHKRLRRPQLNSQQAVEVARPFPSRYWALPSACTRQEERGCLDSKGDFVGVDRSCVGLLLWGDCGACGKTFERMCLCEVCGVKAACAGRWGVSNFGMNPV
ncbi:hypothetical protein Ae201684P_008326 [Aphanomyces euteiches]|nr:hypothetical protein Ae201684P_008326 [Aphanomyces euteiches]